MWKLSSESLVRVCVVPRRAVVGCDCRSGLSNYFEVGDRLQNVRGFGGMLSKKILVICCPETTV